MTEHHGYKHSRDFVCVDTDPEYTPSTHANNNGALLYPVEGFVAHYLVFHMSAVESRHALCVPGDGEKTVAFHINSLQQKNIQQ